MEQNLILKRLIAIGLAIAFLGSLLQPSYAQELVLPAPGVMVHLSPLLNPPILKGIKVHPDNPFLLDFILSKGDSTLSNGQLKDESMKLVKYFLVSMTVPEKDLWVNLSPYEKDRIISKSFGLTEMGRDLLAEDYMLKQITASLIYPEDEVGKRFWKRVYEEAAKRYGTTNIPVNTFNKVWIVPEKAVVYENAQAGTAYVVKSRLKVMLEQDYLSLQKHLGIQSNVSTVRNTNQLGSQVVREVVIPELNKEVNEGKNFVQLRQVYNSLILAAWFKKKIRDSILSQVYSDKNKIAGVKTDDPQEKEIIYQRYLKAFKKGVYNFIKEEQGPMTQEVIPRKYFSGGVAVFGYLDRAMSTTSDSAQLPAENDEDITVGVLPVDQAMITTGIGKLVGALLGRSSPVATKPDLTIAGTIRIDTDMTLNYGGLKKWGLERILIDLVQNHAPGDSKGTKVQVIIHLKDGTALSLHDERLRNLKADDVESIEISDDGIGYDYEHLKYFLTTKGSIEEAGKFGEGLKIATAAGMLQGMEFEFHSRGWKAVPFTGEKILNEGHANQMKTEYISFAVTGNGSKKGSSTFIKKPSQRVLNAIKELPKLILFLRKDYKPMAKANGIGEVVERGRTIFIKGNRVTEIQNIGRHVTPSLFSYNIFDDSGLNRDRDFVPENTVEEAVKKIFLYGMSPEVAKIILESISRRETSYESELAFYSYGLREATTLNVWRNVFYQLYGQEAILGANSKYSGPSEQARFAMRKGSKVILMPENGLYNILAASGIGTAEALYANEQVKEEFEVKTGVSLDYREKAWGFNRILLDAVQNHLAADSGGTETKVEFSTNGDEWIDLDKINDYRNRSIRAVRVTDNGHGYDYQLLGVFHSTKASSYQAGQWGEGIKLLSAAALRSGLNIELRSRNWQAKAVEKTREFENADNKKVEIKVLGYDMHYSVDGQQIKGSETIFTNLSDEFLNLVRRLPKMALMLDKGYVPVSRTQVGEVTSTSVNNIYVNGLEVKDEMNDHKTLLGYNFIGVDGIIASPDRNVLSGEKIKKAVGMMVAQMDSPDAVAVIINKAIDAYRESHPEFVNVTKVEGFKNREIWRTAWDAVVVRRGWNPKKIVLATQRILLDPDAQILLRNMGYRIIQINDNIAPIVHDFGIHYDYELLKPNFEYLNPDDLTTQEKKMLTLADIIDKKVGEILNMRVTRSNIRVFSTVRSTVTGEELSGWLGEWDKERQIVGIARSQLVNPIMFGQTYLEELGHRLSDAGDYTREFTNFFRNALLTQIYTEAGVDSAMTGQQNHVTPTGGIDLTPANMNLQTQNPGGSIKFYLDTAMLAQVQNAPGFVPVIINIQPIRSLRMFLGLAESSHNIRATS